MGVGVGVGVDSIVIAGSERIDDVGVDTKLAEVAMCEDEVGSVDDFGSVVLENVSRGIKGPIISVKRVLWQHPAAASAVPSGEPQHQLWAVNEPLFTGQGYKLLKLLTAAVIASAKFLCGVRNLRGSGPIAYSLYMLDSNSATAM